MTEKHSSRADHVGTAVFERDLDPNRIIAAISAMYGVQIQKGTTLIIFDEIQACERALTSLKYFNEQANEYHIVAAGSLLGLAVNRGQYSFPVGKVDKLTMYPLSFEEFLCKYYRELQIQTKIFESYFIDIGIPEDYEKFVKSNL